MIMTCIILLVFFINSCTGNTTLTQAAESSKAPSAQPTRADSPTVPAPTAESTSPLSYPIVDTGQANCYNNNAKVTCPQVGQAFFGQDAQFTGNMPSYALSADGLTVLDNITGLTWQHSPDTTKDGILNKSDKLTLSQAQALPAKLNGAHFGGYDDWRLPSIKELYSLIDFRGTDPSSANGMVTLTPFIDTAYFLFAYGDSRSGERTIDSQYASSTTYVNKTSLDGTKLFGVNFADGRIKGYGLSMPGGAEKTFFVICVRGNDQYGRNNFIDNGDQTITDRATGLMWAKTDSGTALNWEDALAWVQGQNSSNFLGHSDWRLPNAKELQSIVDYSRSPDATDSPAIDPIFKTTRITNEAGQSDYPAFWSGTTHASSDGSGGAGIYIAFGRGMGYMGNAWVDVHGAGAQRSDPKAGSESEYPTGRGPQGDAIRINNYVRLVRAGNVIKTYKGGSSASLPSMTIQSTGSDQSQPSGMPAGKGQQGNLPPLEAIKACSAGAQGSTCQFNSPNGIISGTCQTIQQQLACVPADRP